MCLKKKFFIDNFTYSRTQKIVQLSYLLSIAVLQICLVCGETCYDYICIADSNFLIKEGKMQKNIKIFFLLAIEISMLTM